MRNWGGFMCLLALGVMGCSETAGTGGSGGDGGVGGIGGTGGAGGIGGTGGAGGIGGDGGTGGAPECQGNDDCDDGKECTEDTCADGVCDNTAVEDGTVCANGECLGGVCAPLGAFPCTEQGIRDAVALGNGPHFFACDGSTPVVTASEIMIDTNVILDGEGKLTVDGNEDHRVFYVPQGVTAELRGFTVTRGSVRRGNGGGIWNEGTLTLIDSTVSDNQAICEGGCLGMGVGGGIFSGFGDAPTMTLRNSTVSGNTARSDGGGIWNSGTITLTNTTVSANTGLVGVGGLRNDGFGTMTLVSSTISGADSPYQISSDGTMSVTNSLVDGFCSLTGLNFASNGHNIESPGDTCGFDQSTDQPDITEARLNLGPLQNNGGPTETHEPGGGEFGTDSVAIDQIPAADCVDPDGAPLTTDQRGLPRPAGAEPMCDVGALEVQP